MSALTDLKDLAARQNAAIAGVRGDIARLKQIIEENPDGINAAGVEELKGLFGSNAEALEQLDAETSDEQTPPTEPEA